MKALRRWWIRERFLLHEANQPSQWGDCWYSPAKAREIAYKRILTEHYMAMAKLHADSFVAHFEAQTDAARHKAATARARMQSLQQKIQIEQAIWRNRR